MKKSFQDSKESMKLSIIYGTRPEFLKLKPLINLLKSKEFNFNVIRIHQHKDFTEDEGYYDFSVEINDLTEARLNNVGSNILIELPKYITDSTHLLAQGDTATVFYSLLTGFQMKKKIIHLEAGMRTYDLNNPYPEEGYRQMISRITDIHLCPSQKEKDILHSESVSGTIHIVGNTILDLVKSYNFELKYNNKILVTLHRRENWDDYKDTIFSLLNLCEKYPTYEFYFISHPNPSLKSIINGSQKIKPLSNFILSPPLNHKDLISLLSECYCVITDSGGIQEEANFLGKHMYVLRKITERNSIPLEKLTLINSKDLENLIFDSYGHIQGFEYGSGDSCEKILEII
jgi:UDP-N-acetylglucosamine 2-epimerase (non-hydrolysing)